MNVVPVYDTESGRITSSFDLDSGRTGGEVKPFKIIKPEPLPDDRDITVRAEKALEARARREAKKAGFRAIKSRARTYSFNNQLGFQVLDAFSGFPVYGWNYELTAQDVIDWLADSE